MNRKKEKGFALILSLVLLLVMSLMGGSLIVITSTDHQSNNNSDQYQQAFYVAETGLMQGEKWVIDQYLGPWIKIGDIPSSTAAIPPPEGSTPAELEAYEAAKEAYDNSVGNYHSHSNNMTRYEYLRGPPLNDYPVKKSDGTIPEIPKTDCMKSFKNIEIAKELKVAGETYMKYFEAGQKFNFSENVQHSFLALIQPILNENNHFLESDSDIFAEIDIDDILQDEEDYLEKFKYEFFVINVGTADYKGPGSSVAKSSSTDLDSTGTAYKVYSCGMYYNDVDDEKADIIIPLESLIVLPG